MYEQFPEVMNMLWSRMLKDNKKNWRRVYKVGLYISQCCVVFVDPYTVHTVVFILYSYVWYRSKPNVLCFGGFCENANKHTNQENS